MPPEAEPSAWDILTLIAWWNLYGLPALLIVVALVVAIRQYNRPAAGSKQELSDDSRAHPLAACRSALDHREFDSSGGRGRLARSLAERALGIGGAPPMMVLIMLLPRGERSGNHPDTRIPRERRVRQTTELARHAMGQFSWNQPRFFPATRNSGRIVAC